MKRFAQLFTELDRTTKVNPKIDALVRFFEDAEDNDRLWCIALLGGKRPKRSIKTSDMRSWCADLANIPLWLLEESYHVVGDLAETIALLLPEATSAHDQPLSMWMEEIQSLKNHEDAAKQAWIEQSWMQLNTAERFVFNKLLTGGFRIGVSQKNVTKALSQFTGKDPNEIAHRLMGNWTPQNITFQELILSENASDDLSKPYPFYLAYPLEAEPESLGDVIEWQVEYKWDGIRGQLIRRHGETYIWSRGEELVTDKYPELQALAEHLPDGTVIDGEIIAHDGERPLPFNLLQTRIGRKTVGKKTLQDAPVRMIAYDLLEWEGKDIRTLGTAERNALLKSMLAGVEDDHLLLSAVFEGKSWEELRAIREKSRENHAEGLMIKRKTGEYKVGRKRGDWYKWKIEPLVIDAVLIYAMRGHGRRANLYTDYTFAVWKGKELVPFAKAYSGLTDAEFKKVDAFVKKNTLERFGPVRSVKPELVFEIAFEGIAKSTRHKSGIALRFPRMSRWRQDKPTSEANTLEDLQAMLEVYG